MNEIDETVFIIIIAYRFFACLLLVVDKKCLKSDCVYVGVCVCVCVSDLCATHKRQEVYMLGGGGGGGVTL